MSETKVGATIPDETRKQLRAISPIIKELNIGSDDNDLWLGSDSSGGYSWEQIDIGVNDNNELITCKQSGCSCYGPERPTPETKHSLDSPIVLEQNVDGWGDDYDLGAAVDETIQQTSLLHKILIEDDFDASDVIGIRNAEVRRAVIERIGYDKVVKDAEAIDTSDTDGVLLKVPLSDDEDLMLVHVKDPSTDREYFLRVPPTMKTARQARAWTFGFEADEFVLEKES